jgi:hypothetical protein
VYDELEKRKIDNYIQGTKDWKALPKPKRKRLYNRRSQTERIINDVLNHR